MRSRIPLLVLLALLTGACGAGTSQGLGMTDAASHALPGIRGDARARKQAATREADRLLHRLAPPHGAVLVRGWPHDYGGRRLSGPGGGPTGSFVDRHTFWVLRAGLHTVARFVVRHAPRHFRCFGCSPPYELGNSGIPHEAHLVFASPSRGLATRILDVYVTQRRTRTIVRLDAQVVWGYPRSPQNRIEPSGA